VRISSSACSPTSGSAGSLPGAGASADWLRFHTSHKMSLLSHSTARYQELGRLVASAAGMPRGRASRCVRVALHAHAGPGRGRAPATRMC
jgi:hypothetical protein